MPRTPLEIRKQEFKKSFRGFDLHEVRTFLEMVASEFENLLRENATLSERNKDLDAKIEDYRRMERILQETLTTTQKTADELKENSRREANLLIENAKLEAAKILKQANAELAKIKEEISMIEHQRLLLSSEFRGLLESYSRLLERLEKKGT
ncbi:MAG: DivIVA domain-containing protein [candidate division WOR-3 bacterium]